MERPFKLVTDTISHDTVQAAKTLVADAERGDLIGFSIAAMYKQGEYTATAVGEAWKSPTFAIGTVVILIYKLIKQVISKQRRS